MVAKDSGTAHQILEVEAGKVLQIRGVGGTGKTISMLQAANKAFDEYGERSLFLTYNKALAVDLLRLMALCGIKSNDENGGVKIETANSFFIRLYKKLEMEDEDLADNFDKYDDRTFDQVYENQLEILSACNHEDLNEIRNKNPFDFDYDRIFVDEAQDWFEGESDVLKNLYNDKPICVADGKQQLLRQDKRTDWFLGTDSSNRHFLNLNKCLRMKSNIYNFILKLSSELEKEWQCDRNDEVSGGRIIIISDHYETNSSLHEELITKSSEKKSAQSIGYSFLHLTG